MLKRHSLAFLLSLLSCFFCLDSLFWHGLASLNLVISTQHHYSAQIDFDMHEFKLVLSVRHWGIIMCLISNERREYALDNEAYVVWLKLAWQWRYLTDEMGFLFSGTHGTYILIITIHQNWFHNINIWCLNVHPRGLELLSFKNDSRHVVLSICKNMNEFIDIHVGMNCKVNYIQSSTCTVLIANSHDIKIAMFHPCCSHCSRC